MGMHVFRNSIFIHLQLELFWMRAIDDRRYRRIFCLVHAEKLSYQVSDLALRSLTSHLQGKKGKFDVKRALFHVGLHLFIITAIYECKNLFLI